MKKILLAITLLIVSQQLFAFATQGKWRWRNDNGSETTATWMAAENTGIMLANSGVNLRLRISLYANGDDGDLTNAELQYATSTVAGTTWTKITADGSTNAFQFAGSSPNVTDQEATTNQMSGEGAAFTFVPGLVLVSTELLPAKTLLNAQQTEYEYCIKATSNLQPSTTYYFRVAAATYPPGDPYPSLTTEATLPIHLASFKVQPDNNRVKVLWTTASELNNDRFEVERSADATNWKTIATIKGNGTSSVAHNYQALDINPAKGMNYYRIKQYDVNGKANVSEIRSLRMLTGKSQIIVFPNPVQRNINFSLQTDLSDAAVTLTNSNGRVVHRESISNIQAGTNHSLKLRQQPAPGVYILHIGAKEFAESIKVVVE